MHATERTEVPTRVPEDVSQSAATGHLSINEDNQIADPVIPAEVPETLAEPRGMSAPMLRTGDGIPDVATEPASQHSLIDAEGNFIEVGDLEELRDAFERLFADPYLSADQITGLWESNELARQHLTEAFGASSLEKARCRHLDAAVQRDRQPSIHSTEPKRAKHPSRKRLRSKQLKIVSSALTTQEVDLSIKIDTTWSDEKLLHHYQARLLALRLGRAKAQTFVNFRLANHAVEDRLRARLPHLMAAIDEVYAWASTQSR